MYDPSNLFMESELEKESHNHDSCIAEPPT